MIKFSYALNSKKNLVKDSKKGILHRLKTQKK